MIEILDQFPAVKDDYLDWIFVNYRATERGYSEAPILDQALGLKVWLGYEQTSFEGRDIDEVKEYILRIVKEYRDACIKYPDPKYDDPLYILNKMDFETRKKEEPKLFNLRGEPTILPSLKDAFDFSAIPKELTEEIEDTEFWTDVVQGGEAPF